MMRYIKIAADWNRRMCDRMRERYPGIFDSLSYKQELDSRIEMSIADQKPSHVLEVGGIDRPLLAKGRGYVYHGIDIEDKEGCHNIYDEFIVQSIESPLAKKLFYDLVVSITLLEHVPNNSAAIANIYSALKPGGVTHHYIPAKWHPYSILLRMIGPKWQKRLIRVLRSGAVEVTGYPAFFDHCSVGEMSELFNNCGFEKIDVLPYYRANDYFAFFVPFYVVVSLIENLCARLNWTALASGFVISAERPAQP